MGTREGIPVDRYYVLLCGAERAPRGAAVGARERMSVGLALLRIGGKGVNSLTC